MCSGRAADPLTIKRSTLIFFHNLVQEENDIIIIITIIVGRHFCFKNFGMMQRHSEELGIQQAPSRRRKPVYTSPVTQPQPPAVPCRRRRRGGLAARRVRSRPCDYPAGPATVDESFCWAEQYMRALENSSEGDISVRLSDFASRGIILTTDYSGSGQAEFSFGNISGALSSRGISPKMTAFRCGDVQPFCRRVLLAHDGGMQPQCVFGDMMDRIEVQ